MKDADAVDGDDGGGGGGEDLVEDADAVDGGQVGTKLSDWT